MRSTSLVAAVGRNPYVDIKLSSPNIAFTGCEGLWAFMELKARSRIMSVVIAFIKPFSSLTRTKWFALHQKIKDLPFRISPLNHHRSIVLVTSVFFVLGVAN